MFTGARFPDSCNGTSNPVQQLTVNVLADLWSHQKPKIATSGYFTWETGQARETASNVPVLRRISAQTVRNRLRENNLRARRPYFGAVLRRRHRLARIRWCNRVEGWDLQNLRRVWFSDESRFMLQKRNGRTCVYRRRNDRFARKCVLEVDNFGGESVMIWGAISYARKTQLVHIPGNLSAARYRDEVLTPHILPAMNLRRRIFNTTTLGRTHLVLLLTLMWYIWTFLWTSVWTTSVLSIYHEIHTQKMINKYISCLVYSN
jgi:hypothetical protein